jgi:hypothetical protein
MLPTPDLIPPDFWDESDDYYTSPEPLTPELLQQAERLLGYQLPAAYLALLRTRNGGTPRNTCFPMSTPTSWAEDHVAISGIMGLGGKWGLDSPELGSQSMLEEWGYPPIGILFGQCPSAGHDAIMLDYSQCGPAGEPQVVHVDVETEGEPAVTFMAATFLEFLRALVPEKVYDTSEEDARAAAAKVATGTFSALLQQLCALTPELPAEAVIRRIAAEIVADKGYFALHADARSTLLYDLQFWLYSTHLPVRSREEYLETYPDMLVFGGGFRTGGYAPDFVEDWWTARWQQGQLEARDGLLQFSRDYKAALRRQLAPYL